jgi:hypothetical protein
MSDTPKPSPLASLTAGLPPAYWLLWVGTLINRLGTFVIPFLTLYLTSRRWSPSLAQAPSSPNWLAAN